jgi:hypothetical protein
MLTEIFDGPPGQEAYLLNPGDPGLLRQLDTIEASAASKRPMPGKTTIAAHVDHVHFGLSILNRRAAGEANPWAGADWNASWQRTTVTEDQWRTLRDGLCHEAEKWRKVVATRTNWDDMGAAAALSTAAHTAYHFGAIRQILAGLNKPLQMYRGMWGGPNELIRADREIALLSCARPYANPVVCAAAQFQRSY